MLIGGGVVDIRSLSNGVAGTAAGARVSILSSTSLPLHKAEAIVSLHQHPVTDQMRPPSYILMY